MLIGCLKKISTEGNRNMLYKIETIRIVEERFYLWKGIFYTFSFFEIFIFFSFKSYFIMNDNTKNLIEKLSISMFDSILFVLTILIIKNINYYLKSSTKSSPDRIQTANSFEFAWKIFYLNLFIKEFLI